MLMKVLFLLCFIQAVESGSWKYLGHGCVGARNNQFLEISYPGPSHFIGAMKLVHTTGFVGNGPPHKTYWGSRSAGSTRLGMVVTDLKNRVIYPSEKSVNVSNTGWYSMTGYTSISPQLVFSDFGHPKYLRKGEKMRIWYGEDLVGYTEYDNHGKTCMYVYVYSI